MRIANPRFVLAVGFLAVLAAGTAPAGLDGRGIPVASWIVWSVVSVAAIALLRAKHGGFVAAARGMAWIVPPIVLLTVPAVVFAAPPGGPSVAGALVARAAATAMAGLATLASIGPVELVAGLRALRLPGRFVDVVHGTLTGLSSMLRRVSEMLRARTARGTGHAPWSDLLRSPIETLGGFGRITGALLLRSLERAESLERARRARGAGRW